METERMKVRDLLTTAVYERTGDIDIYDDYDERCGCAWCGTLLTKEGEKEFHTALDLDCCIVHRDSLSYLDNVTVHCETGRQASAIARLIESMAGYCDSEDYDKWFCEPDEEQTEQEESREEYLEYLDRLDRKEREEKAAWTRDYLKPLLVNIEYQIEDAVYSYDEDSHMETVTVTYKGGGQHKANVSADSKVGILHDICKQIL